MKYKSILIFIVLSFILALYLSSCDQVPRIWVECRIHTDGTRLLEFIE